VTFSWYLYVSYSPWLLGANDIQTVINRFSFDFLNPEARVDERFFPVYSSIVIDVLDRLLFYVRNGFIFIGITNLVMKKPTETNFKSEYRLMAIISMIIIFLCVAIPNFAPTLNLTRFYQVVLLVLSPFFVLGGKTFVRWTKCLISRLSKSKVRGSRRNLDLQIISMVLIASFLFQVGLVNHVSGEFPVFSPLDFNRIKKTDDLHLRISFYAAYNPEQDIFGAKWLSRNIGDSSRIYGDSISRLHVLAGYGLISPEQTLELSNTTILKGSCIYLRRFNVVDGFITHYFRSSDNIDEISHILDESNKIYSNGDSEIYLTH